MSNYSFNSLLAEAAELALAEDKHLTESVLDDEVGTLIEGLDEALFEGAEDDFAPNFNPAIDQYQFFNQAHTSLTADELDALYNPDNTADINNSNHGDHHTDDLSEENLFALDEGCGEPGCSDDFLDNPTQYPTDIIPEDEQLHEEDLSELYSVDDIEDEEDFGDDEDEEFANYEISGDDEDLFQ